MVLAIRSKEVSPIRSGDYLRILLRGGLRVILLSWCTRVVA
jgi:hypothetical protein